MALLFTVIWFVPCAQDYSCSSSTWQRTSKTHLIGCLRSYTLSCGHIKCLRLQQTQDLLQNFHLATLDYQLYGTDLSPSHFHLSPALKPHLSGHHFTCDDVKCATITWLTQQGYIFLHIQDGQTYYMLWKVCQPSRELCLKMAYQWHLHCTLSVSSVKILPLMYGYCKLTFWSTITRNNQHDRKFHNIWIFRFWTLSVCTASSAAIVQTVWKCLNIPQYGLYGCASVCHITDTAEAYMYLCVTL